MLKRIFVFFALFIITVGAFAQSKYDFTKRKALRVYPSEAAEYLKHSAEDGYLMQKPAELPSLSAYYYVNPPANAKAFLYKLTYKSSKGVVPKLAISFNKPNGRNGSNGAARMNFPPSEDWNTHEVLITIPDGTATMQIIHGSDDNSYEITLKEAEINFLADDYVIERKTAGFDATLRPELWNVQSLPGFYLCVTAEPASVQTEMKITYDEEKLYVGLIALNQGPEKLLAEIDDKSIDARIFTDDCLEIFISSAERNLAWQFAVNANNSRFDAEVKQNMAGDPWRVFSEWNGDWESYVFRGKDNWQATFVIPWSTLDFRAMPENPIGINAGRENKGSNENSQWNAYDGNFHAVEKYAVFDLKSGKLTRTRRIDRASYIIERENPQFESVLSDEPGNFVTGTWGGAGIGSFPEKIRNLYSKEEQLEWQNELLRARGEAGMLGFPLPWAPWNIIGGWDKMKELYDTHGTRFPYVLFNSAVIRGAVEAGAEYHFGTTGVDPACPGYRGYVIKGLEDLKTKHYYDKYLEHVALIFGIDEPTNQVPQIFSKTRNSELSEAIDRADAEIKEKTGFGKYGIYDAYAEPTENVEFDRIAFWRWWNSNFAIYCKEVKAKVNEVFPGVEFKAFNRNTVSGLCTIDIALMGPHSDSLSCDPYPTSTSNLYGFSRAIYHPGFTAKMLGDLAAVAKLGVTPQNFIYHGGRPEPDEIREWASQCLKAGADLFYWYIENADTLMNMWEGNLEVLAINKQLRTLPKLKLPETTSTAILHSDYDRWANMDNVLHAAYSLHAILGEQVKAWFKFISPTGLALGTHNLDDYKVVYVPRMKFTDPETTAKIMSFVNNGGTLIVFDPEIFSFNIDGTKVAERATLLGSTLKVRELSQPQLNYAGKSLPVYKIAHLTGSWQGKYQAYDFEKMPRGSKVVATYADDNKAAIIERSVGKGKLIFSAIQPFGTSDAALQETAWADFARKICGEINEPTGLPIWDFELKRFPEHKVELNLNRKW